MNPIWTWDGFDAFAKDISNPVFYDKQRYYSTAYINLHFTRQGYGVVFRLATPITIFVLVLGLSFWAEIDKRMDIAINMLLVTSAMYLVIGSVIPFVGYLTKLDLFVTVAFLAMALVIAIHVIVQELSRKSDKYPFSLFLVSFSTFCMRLVVLPCALLLPMLFFNYTNSMTWSAFSALAAVSAIQG